MREMRKSGRVFTRCPAVVKVLNTDGAAPGYGSPRYGHTSDFSAGGMRLVLADDLPPGATIEVTVVMLEPPATFRHQGRVTWCKDSTEAQKRFVGVEFTYASPTVKQAWLRLLAERFPFAISKSPQFARDDASIW